MLSIFQIVAVLAAFAAALPAPEPVEYDDYCTSPLSQPTSTLPFISSPPSASSGEPSGISQAAAAATTSTSVDQGIASTTTSQAAAAATTEGTGAAAAPTSTTPLVNGFNGTITTTPPIPQPSGNATNSTGGSSAGNPFAGKQLYANPYYASEISASAIPVMTANKAQASAVAQVGTFSWLDSAAKVPNVGTYLGNIQKLNQGGSSQTIGAFVVYDLPNRDCAASASNGEYSVANGGLAKYEAYIDAIKSQLTKYPDVPVALVIEPDSLGNLVTNVNVPNCSAASDAYKSGIAYALKTLDAPNVSQYLDAGHAGWLGWPANIGPAAQLFAQVYKAAGSPKSVRGLATNVANYNAWSTTSCPSYTQGSKVCDEKTYINNLAPLLQQNGFPAHFIIDTGRNGKQPTGQQAWGDWCNVKSTGFGSRFTTDTGDPLADAFVWVKPGGESDGTSNSTAPRYDQHCGSSASLQPAPQAGNWFEAYFEQLVSNADPAF